MLHLTFMVSKVLGQTKDLKASLYWGIPVMMTDK